MRKILIPTDFSESSINAIKYGLELFKYERSEFIILNAYADEVYDASNGKSREEFNTLKDATYAVKNEKVQDLVHTMLKLSPNPRHTYEYEIHFDTLVDSVNTIVERDNLDLVIMGTRGETNDKDVIFGSNTLHVIKYVKCPVLAVPTI